VEPQLDLFVIWGSGGHGRVVAELVRQIGGQVLGFVDRDPAKLGAVVEPGGSKGICTEGEFLHRLADGYGLPQGASALAVAIGDNSTRRKCRLAARQIRMPALIHPGATVSASASIGEASVVLAASVVNAVSVIGAGVIINTRVVIEHDCRVEDDVHVSPGAVLCGGVHIHAQACVGAGAVVIPGIRVGARSTIGAGAVVISDVPPGATVVGNPARIIREA
jgi:sugar O-acyltransferase (sialic acid O-acetyltransferase NeuD family)